MRRTFSAWVVLATAACGAGVTDPVASLEPGDLVGTYILAAYDASPLTAGLSGALNLTVSSSFTPTHEVQVDSLYTLSLSRPDAWSNAASGRWSWTGSNVLLTASETVYIFGSILNDGIGFTATGYPALYLRKQ